jgi:hypothetical protein
MKEKHTTHHIKNQGEKKWLYRSLTELVMSDNKRTAVEKEQKANKKVPKRTNEGHWDYRYRKVGVVGNEGRGIEPPAVVVTSLGQ